MKRDLETLGAASRATTGPPKPAHIAQRCARYVDGCSDEARARDVHSWLRAQALDVSTAFGKLHLRVQRCWHWENVGVKGGGSDDFSYAHFPLP